VCNASSARSFTQFIITGSHTFNIVCCVLGSVLRVLSILPQIVSTIIVLVLSAFFSEAQSCLTVSTCAEILHVDIHIHDCLYCHNSHIFRTLVKQCQGFSFLLLFENVIIKAEFYSLHKSVTSSSKIVLLYITFG
jgi:hypothetical protein